MAIRGEKTAMSLTEQQRFLVEGLPHVSAVIAKRLLIHFGNIRSLTSASIKDLCAVKGVGKGIAEEIIRVFREEFRE